MIRVYTNKQKFDSNTIVIDNNSFFNNNISSKIIDKYYEKVMFQIDRATLVDKRTGKIETPFGIAEIKDLSLGCKTALNVIYIISSLNKYQEIIAVDATECGWNALEIIFEILEKNDSNLIIVIEHDCSLYKCKNRQYQINDKKVVNSLYYM